MSIFVLLVVVFFANGKVAATAATTASQEACGEAAAGIIKELDEQKDVVHATAACIQVVAPRDTKA